MKEEPGFDVTEAVPVTIHNYELALEAEAEINGEEFTSTFSVVLPPDVASIATRIGVTTVSKQNSRSYHQLNTPSPDEEYH